MILDKKRLTGAVFGVGAVLSVASPVSGYESEIARAHIQANSSSYSVSVDDTFTLGSAFDENTFIGTRDNIDAFEYSIEPVRIVQNAIEQISQLNYIKVDDVIDREIDAYFAKRESKKVKKILLKG